MQKRAKKAEPQQPAQPVQQPRKPVTTKDDEWARLEYEKAHERWTNGTNQRRAGLAFLTTVQGTILTLIGPKLFQMDASSRTMTVFAILVAVSGWNHERRIGAYMRGYQRRAIEIEETYGMNLFKNGVEEAKKAKTLSNRRLFGWYFMLLLTLWVGILAIDIVKVLRRY